MFDDRDEDGNGTKNAETFDVFGAEMSAFVQDLEQDKTQMLDGNLTLRGLEVVG